MKPSNDVALSRQPSRHAALGGAFTLVCLLLPLDGARAAPALLRNDAITDLASAAPALEAIFTGRGSGCSSDPSVSLDRAAPGDCSLSVEGEGPDPSLNGSDDDDDLYVATFLSVGGAVPEPEADLLGDPDRPLILWQVEHACSPGGLLVVKDLGRSSVSLLHGRCGGACCHRGGACSEPATPASCAAEGGSYARDGTACADVPAPCSTPGACCDPLAGCFDAPDLATCEASPGDSWRGGGTACADVPAPCAGACCGPFFTCGDVDDSSDCTLGAWAGPGTSCAAASCTTTTGACCLSPGSCLDATTAGVCGDLFGSFYAGILCADSPCS